MNDLMVFYPLVAAVGGLLFWSGTLSQRVKTNEREIAALKTDADGAGTLRERLGRFEERLDTLTSNAAQLSRGMEGVQRQLGNLMQRGQAGVTELRHGD